MPGLPLFFRTRFSATPRLLRCTTCSIRSSVAVPERSFPFDAVRASPLRSALGASPLPQYGSSSCPVFWCLALLSLMVVSLSFPFDPLPREASGILGDPCRLHSGLLWPLLTSRSGTRGVPSPFQAQGEISLGKRKDLRCTVAGYTPHPFGRGSFAVVRPLAPGCTASNPVSVRRPAVFAPHFFQPRPHGLRLVVCSRSLRPGFSTDFHHLDPFSC
jgi:hypothetical protein